MLPEKLVEEIRGYPEEEHKSDGGPPREEDEAEHCVDDSEEHCADEAAGIAGGV